MLWESAGAFFPRDNSLISRGNSHVSRVRGLVVRCLLFNPEVSCSNPWVCANFFTSIPKQMVLTFFGNMRLFGFVRLFFGFVRLFFRNFFNVPKKSFQFFDILQENECSKIPKGPFFQNFRHYETVQNFNFFSKIFLTPLFFSKIF